MLELFGHEIERGLGLDMSLDMLLLARDRLERAGLRHCSVRQGDLYDPQELIERATGTKLDSKPYLQYLNKKYSGLYGF